MAVTIEIAMRMPFKNQKNSVGKILENGERDE